ncbi:MAG TPA: hypothetical protein PLF40_25395 [Kofleriaceae bacterium]|nr:hypothetical protein [Kofleriaceae bacterium]
MPIDRKSRGLVACQGALFVIIAGVSWGGGSACGPRYVPESMPNTSPIVKSTRSGRQAGPGQQILLGEMCMQAAAGRPAVDPLLLRGVQWGNDPAELSSAIERNSSAEFAVLGMDGVRAGIFVSLGLADVPGLDGVAAGSYSGASPCTRLVKGGDRAEDPACNTTMKGCGLAIADLGPGRYAPELGVGAACVRGDALVVDIDGDGQLESFATKDMLDTDRSPAGEWLAQATVATATAAPACAPTFTIYNTTLSPERDADGKADVRYNIGFDLLGVVDLDGDGRVELIGALRYPDARTIVVYSARTMSNRLELIGEARASMH